MTTLETLRAQALEPLTAEQLRAMGWIDDDENGIWIAPDGTTFDMIEDEDRMLAAVTAHLELAATVEEEA